MTAKGTYVPLPPGKRFGNALRRSMQQRDVTIEALAAKGGIAERTLYQWRRGNRLPNIKQGMAVVEALGDIALGDLLVELRTHQCEACGADFIVRRSPDAKYCNRSVCRFSHIREKRNALRREQREDVQRHATRSLVIIREAVNAFCWDCEPEGVCRQSTCQLRKHSPLPLADERLRIA